MAAACNTMSDLFMNNMQQQQSSSVQTDDVTAADNANADEDDAFENVLSLKLKKPKHWKWELSTSRSCCNIALPRILLYDHKGNLLVDANSQTEQIYKETNNETTTKSSSRKRSSKAATTNLSQTIRQAIEREFNGLQIQEATPSQSPTPERQQRSRQPKRLTAAASAIDFYSNELPDYKFERRANSLKGVRFQVDDDNSSGKPSVYNISDLPTPPSTTATNTTSSSSGPSQKRRYRRSHSSARSPASSESILERFSFHKGRFSSPEMEQILQHDIYHAPLYFLRTSKAGTLVVQEESFRNQRRRRRPPKHSSSENILNDLTVKSCSNSSLKTIDVSTLPNVLAAGSAHSSQSSISTRKKKLHRRRSDGNILLQNSPSSTDEDNAELKHSLSKYCHFRRPHKQELLTTIDSDNDITHFQDSVTSR